MPEQTTPAERGEAEAKIEFGSRYYRCDCGVPYERNEHWLGFFDRIAESVVREFHPATVLDVGCAMGFLVEGLRKRGVAASGIDVSEHAISQVHESVAEHCRVGSVTEPLGGHYDLITCIEVLEHLPPSETDAAIANLCAATDVLLISSTPDDYREATHLNVRPPEEWSALLAREGFLRDLDHDLSYLTPWAAVYRRVEEPLPETVRRYDRAWWRLRREVHDVREALLDSRRRLDELEEEERRPELLAELDRRQEEILRLRDLLVGKDAELGSVYGRLAALEHQTRSLSDVAVRVHSRAPGLLRLGGFILRRLRALSRRG